MRAEETAEGRLHFHSRQLIMHEYLIIYRPQAPATKRRSAQPSHTLYGCRS
jgi:hypothetical protein